MAHLFVVKCSNIDFQHILEDTEGIPLSPYIHDTNSFLSTVQFPGTRLER